MSQMNLISSDLHVFELPQNVALSSVELRKVNSKWQAYFITVSGEMVLGKKSNIKEARGFIRIQAALDTLNKLGWTGDILIKRGY